MKLSLLPKPLGVFATAASLTLLVACALPPESNESVARAQETIDQARQSPAVAQHASVQLRTAEDSLEKAESLWNEYGDDRIELIEHHAYLAQQQALTALQRAALGEAQEEMKLVSRDRDRVLLEAREQELQSVRARAAEAELQARMAEERASGIEQQQQANRQQENRELQELRETVQSLKAQQTERGMVLTLDDVLFDFGEAELKPGGERAVAQLASFLEQNPDRQLLVEGFTDAVGDEEFNEGLSRQRAESVREQLLAAGIAPDRIEVKGYGENYPIASNETTAGRQLNRRVEVVIGSGGGEPEPRMEQNAQQGEAGANNP